MLIDLTLAELASRIVSAHVTRQPPTAPPQSRNSMFERGI